MFAIALKQEQYKTYILTDESAASRVEIVPERGGIVTQWQLNGQDIFYLDHERFTNPELSVRGGIPILFPICGNLPDNTYQHQEQAYVLKQHGFARDLPWEVGDRVTDDHASLTLHLQSNDQTRAVYPFNFELAFTYRLQGNSLAIHQQVTNTSNEVMPFSIGFHPYFQVTDKSSLQFDIPSSAYQPNREQAFKPFDGTFDFNLDEIDVAFKDLTRQTTRVKDLSRQLQLTIDYDPLYSTLVFWTVKGKDFYCLEPWSAPRNALNTGEHLTHLEPGASLETVIKFTIDFL
jgi:galactose mutarotase-like enzyme